MQAGDVALYAGQLLTPKLAVTLGQKAQWAEQWCDLELKLKLQTAAIELAQAQAFTEHCDSLRAKEQAAYRAALEASKPSWVEHPVTVAVATALTLILIYRVSR
jgi:hypothetical protein